MPLNAQQAAQIKADILANPDLNIQPGPDVPDISQAIANLYNQNASPDWWAWRRSVTKTEYVSELGPSGTTFSWSGSGGFIARSANEQNAWRELFNGTNSVNPSLANVRQAFADIFSGSGAAAVANRAHLTAVSRRLASRVEKLLGIGTGSTAVPGLLGYEGPITASEIEYARNLS